MKVHEDAKDDSQQLMADAVSKELKDVILSAMRRLKPRHRAILTLRCFRQMRYEHIAESMQCTQFGAKVQFYRAKKAMQKQLARQGFSGGMFVTALVIFGKITAPSEAVAKVIAIPAAMTKVGVAAGLAAMATTKAGILAATAAGVITLGTIVATPGTNQATAPPTEGPAISSQITASAAAKGVREYWHYYPQGANGPVMMRLLKWDPRAKRSGSRMNGQTTSSTGARIQSSSGTTAPGAMTSPSGACLPTTPTSRNRWPNQRVPRCNMSATTAQACS